MKTKFKYVGLMVVLVAIVCAVFPPLTSKAVPNYGPSPVVNSASTTNTVVNFPAWPNAAVGKTTNFTRVDITPGKDVAIQWTCASTNSTTTSNAVLYVYRAVSTTAPTNALGTSLSYDALGSITNTLNGTASITTCATYSAASGGVAGITTLYIGYIDVPANSALTNYSVWVGNK